MLVHLVISDAGVIFTYFLTYLVSVYCRVHVWRLVLVKFK